MSFISCISKWSGINVWSEHCWRGTCLSRNNLIFLSLFSLSLSFFHGFLSFSGSQKGRVQDAIFQGPLLFPRASMARKQWVAMFFVDSKSLAPQDIKQFSTLSSSLGFILTVEWLQKKMHCRIWQVMVASVQTLLFHMNNNEKSEMKYSMPDALLVLRIKVDC